MVIIIRFFSIVCQINIPSGILSHPCLDLSRSNQLYAVHRTYKIENWELKILWPSAVSSFKFQVSRLASLTLLWLGIVNKFPLLSLCATFKFQVTFGRFKFARLISFIQRCWLTASDLFKGVDTLLLYYSYVFAGIPRGHTTQPWLIKLASQSTAQVSSEHESHEWHELFLLTYNCRESAV